SVFVREGGKIKGVNRTQAHILAEKYPGRLAGLCAEILKNATSEAQPFSLAEAIATARLPEGERTKILSDFSQDGSLEQKRCVLQVLATVDQRRCAELVTPIFDMMPKDAAGPYWTCPEAAFTHVVMQIEDDDTWRRYAEVARRSSVGLRMEMMNP